MIPTPHTWIEINQNALAHNFKMYKKAIGARALGVVVKSNAYGHGIVEVARACQASPDVDWLFTATLSEALQLRMNGITKPILVIYFIDEDPAKAIAYDIDVMVSDLQALDELNDLGIALAKPCNIHLKIDSGMSRFGFMPEQAVEIVKKAQSMPGLFVNNIYSYL